MAEKLDRKQLKKPDEFQVIAGKAMEWVAANQKQVVAGLVALLVLVLAVWGLSAWRSSREAKAGGALAQALEVESRPIAGEGPAQPGQDTFPNKDERTKAALAALEKVRAEHGGTTAGDTALAEIGFLKLKSGDAAGAQKDLSDFLANAKDHPLRAFAQESLGYAYEAQGKLDDAKAAFGKLRDYDMPARADYQEARLALEQHKPDATQQLERIAKEYSKDTDIVRAANERLEIAALPPYTAPAEQPKAPEAKPEPKPAEKPKAAPKKPQAKKKK